MRVTQKEQKGKLGHVQSLKHTFVHSFWLVFYTMKMSQIHALNGDLNFTFVMTQLQMSAAGKIFS